MSKISTRINVTFDLETAHAIHELASDSNESLATFVRKLVAEAIEERESRGIALWLSAFSSAEKAQGKVAEFVDYTEVHKT